MTSSTSNSEATNTGLRPWRVLLWMLGFCGGYLLLLHVTGWQATHAETNLEANRIRIQALDRKPRPKAILCGSSLSGRLIPEYFRETALAPFACLGLDGCGTLTGLRILHQSGEVPLVVLVEINTLHHPVHPLAQTVVRGATDPTSRLARWIPLLRAENRPFSVLYSSLKRRMDRRSSAGITIPPQDARTQALEGGNAIAPTDAEREAAAILRDLSADGSRVVFVAMPYGRAEGVTQPSPFVLALAGELHAHFLDVVALARAAEVPLFYSDGVHLTASSARACSLLLANRVGQQLLGTGVDSEQ